VSGIRGVVMSMFDCNNVPECLGSLVVTCCIGWRQ
jgi:hypothetical protein